MTGIEPFAIATLSVETGGRIGLCRLPGRSGHLAEDVASIAAWKPGLVVSLTKMTEMDRLGAAGLREQLTIMRIGWRHFPIVDFGTPKIAATAAWAELSKELHKVLDGGGGVLLHCQGGLGRSGMIALRLLVEAGEEAKAALDRLRTTRPGAVETEEQRLWATRGW